MLIPSLKYLQNLSKINLNRNNLSDEICLPLGKLLETNPSIIAFNLGGNQISENGIKILTHYLIGNTTFMELILKANYRITDEAAPYLKEILSKSEIKEININETSISINCKKEIQALAKVPSEAREIPIRSTSKSASKVFKNN